MQMNWRTSSVFVVASLVAMPRAARAAPGDVLARITAPYPCIGGLVSVAYDGRTLYFTKRGAVAIPEEIGRVDARTGTDLGPIVIKRNGTPVIECCSGIEFDPNRAILWAGWGDYLRAVDPATGEIVRDIFRMSSSGGNQVAYDAGRDIIWVNTIPGAARMGFCPDDDSYCTQLPGLYSVGMAWDGNEMWHTSGNLSPPAPTWPSVLYPADLTSTPDWTRAVDGGVAANVDIAYDCVTFSVPVVWSADNDSCIIRAFEVASRARCPGPNPLVLLRSSVADLSSRLAELPLTPASADRAWQMPNPPIYRDNGDPSPILNDPLRPLAFYRLILTDRSDPGNVLRLVKESSTTAVLARTP